MQTTETKRTSKTTPLEPQGLTKDGFPVRVEPLVRVAAERKPPGVADDGGCRRPAAVYEELYGAGIWHLR